MVGLIQYLCLQLAFAVALYQTAEAIPFTFNKSPLRTTPTLELTVEDGRSLTENNECRVLLVESIPQNLTYSTDSPKHASTFFAWNVLLDQATTNLSIASFYWSLSAEPMYNRSAVQQGRDIYTALLAKSKLLNVIVAQSGAERVDAELDALQAAGAKVVWVDVTRLLGRGILHTKMWIADQKHAYLGSANMDWRSLTEVKELGALFLNCPSLVKDMNKIHGAYCHAAEGIPSKWPSDLVTVYNRTNPMKININGINSRVYFSSSPIEFSPPGRTFDLDAILSTIAEAKRFVYISVMDYSPEVVNYDHFAAGKYWPAIDDALRVAAVDRGVEVRLLISRWHYSSPSMIKYLSSLRALNGIRGSQIRVRYFIVPLFTDDQRIIPHARVNHNKYMVTDQTAYIGTSNWSGDYFLYTGGAAFVIEEDYVENASYDFLHYPNARPKTIRAQLTDIFFRDWNSEYSFED